MDSGQVYRITDVFDFTSRKAVAFGIGPIAGALRPGMMVLLPPGAPASCVGRIVGVEHRQHVDGRECTAALWIGYQSPEERTYLLRAFPVGGEIEVTSH